LQPGKLPVSWFLMQALPVNFGQGISTSPVRTCTVADKKKGHPLRVAFLLLFIDCVTK
jgi:hypothetical protein